MVIGFGAEESMKKAKKAQGEDKIKICAHKRLEFDGPRFVRSVSAALYFDSIWINFGRNLSRRETRDSLGLKFVSSRGSPRTLSLGTNIFSRAQLCCLIANATPVVALIFFFFNKLSPYNWPICR